MSSSEVRSVQAIFQRVFESYGVLVRIESDSPELVDYGLDVARTALVGRMSVIENAAYSPDHTFLIGRDADGRLYFTSEGEFMGAIDLEEDFRRFLNTMIRIHVAEKARGWVFIHAGVVGYRGKAIVLPAASRNGKTTLVSELLRAGAEYFSDEYAVLDVEGLVHPYPRDLSVRTPGKEDAVPVSPALFGGTVGLKPLPIGLVVLTKYTPGSSFRPEIISQGMGMMEIVPEVIPIRANTNFSLKVLNTAFRSAIIIKSQRGEAREVAPKILSYFDENLP